VKEEEIRPQHIFSEYLRLCEIDTVSYFSDVEKFEINCPSCQNKGDHSFTKNNFKYKLCAVCSTLYVSPRPIESAFIRYYIESPSVKYWATTFYKDTADSRRKKLWEPKAKMIFDIMNQYSSGNNTVVDIGAGFGIFCEEIKRISKVDVIAIEPVNELAEICRNKNLNVVEKFLQDVSDQDLTSSPKTFVSFELIEHLYDPRSFFSYIYNLMNSGDILIFTTLSGAGVDIQALWENHNSVSPPHHLNFFNPSSIKILLNKVGFKVLEVTTPGKLDLDILLNNQELIKDNFWKTFIKQSTEQDRDKWQSFISSSGHSSHMMICCQK
jgi:2-polyprenyl-3-methyl-5-hydroxy-6-metoxy-1,4-benzoquinol methylase